jgi:DNA (cytosine-5)-methyltransferase 1
VALERRGFECVFSSDIDPYAQEAYMKNFGEKPEGDITEISNNRIPKHDILCAGFPCQAFSISGKMGGISDSRGRLFYEVIRVAEYRKPYVLLLENVGNILSIDGGNVASIIEKKLDLIGYDLHKHVLNSSFFGVPQARKRVYFVAIRKDLKDEIKYERPKETFQEIFLEDVLETNVDKSLFLDRLDVKMTKDERQVKNELKPIRIGIVNKGGQGERIYSPKGHAITLSAYGGGAGAKTGLYLTKEGIRRLSIAECKRAMSFPEEHYVIEGSQGYKQLGNAVAPDIIARVLNGIVGM